MTGQLVGDSAVLGDVGIAALDALVALALGAVPSVAGVIIAVSGRPVVCAGDGVVRDLYDVEVEGRGGPCASATGGTVFNVALADQAEVWPELARVGAAGGVVGVFSVPVGRHQGSALGRMTVYSWSLVSDADACDLLLAARVAAEILESRVEVTTANQTIAQMTEALATRDVIGQAKGVLMVRESCSADDAFDILRRASQRTNRKLHDVAADLVATTARR